MTAKFIMSFDCEGKWGVADHVGLEHEAFFTNQNLFSAYKKLLDLFDRYEMKATFAFVAAFTFSIEQYKSCKAEFKDVLVGNEFWLSQFRKDMEVENAEGWLVPECYDIVYAAKEHEIASHGFTHLPLDEKTISHEDFCHEMAMIKKYAPYKDHPNLTFIYPRNKIGYTQDLEKYGFIGYREVLTHAIKPKKMATFLQELNIFANSDSPIKSTAPVIIPPGRFLNWRNGMRKRIPIDVTIRRWEHMLKDAIQNNGILHLWSHPHNFITGADMFTLLEEILKRVAQAQQNGLIHNVTQQQYCLDALR